MYKKDAANQKGGGKSETEEEIEKQHICKVEKAILHS